MFSPFYRLQLGINTLQRRVTEVCLAITQHTLVCTVMGRSFRRLFVLHVVLIRVNC